MARTTILDLFVENAEQHGSKVAALVKLNGRYEERTWKQLYDDAMAAAAGLMAQGVSAGDRVIIISNTRAEWVTLDMGILHAGGITVPVYPSSLPEECGYIAENSGAVLAFAEDDKQTAKLMAERKNMPGLKRVVQMTGAVPSTDDGWVIAYDAFIKQGGDVEKVRAELENRRKTLKKDSPFTLIYTSGTTGKPKGVVLTHDAMAYEAEAVQAINVLRESDIQLFFLPLSHSFGRVLEAAWLSCRYIMAFAESMQTIRDNLGEVRPTIMCGVPRVFEKFYSAVVQKGTAPGGLKAKLFNAAVELSQKNGEAEQQGRSLGVRDSLKFGVLKKLVFSKVGKGLRDLLGGRMRILVSGGAPLSPKINWFFRDAGIEILEGYGLTETSAASFVNRPGQNSIGSVGLPLPGTEVKIAPDGEILIKGRGVMKEYWNNPSATAEVLKDGWFQTGDIGMIEPGGTLKITDRKKDIIVTAGGKNVAPQNIENVIKTHKLVSQAVVHGDKRKYLTAVVTLDPDVLKTVAKEEGFGNGSVEELSKRPEIEKMIDAWIGEVNKQLASYESIKRFAILDHDFSVEGGEMTPSLKIKRKVVNERYKKIFDSMYEGAGDRE